VGLQGLGLSEVAYQNGLIYALDRKQGVRIDEKAIKDAVPATVTIIKHPDVRRELLTAKAQAEGARMLAYWTAMQLDIYQKHPDADTRELAKKFVDLLTPVIKAHFTDNGFENANAAMQVFGGHGYIKEHGMEQFSRDARITRLYEGTNGIQALDLIGRKVLMSREGLLNAYLKQVRKDLKASGMGCAFTRPVCKAACKLQWATRKLFFKAAIGKMTGKMGPVLLEAAASAPEYLKLASLVAMGHMWVKMAGVAKKHLAESPDNKDFYETKIKTARFYMDKIMPQMHGLAAVMNSGADSLMAIPEENFAHQQTTVGEK